MSFGLDTVQQTKSIDERLIKITDSFIGRLKDSKKSLLFLRTLELCTARNAAESMVWCSTDRSGSSNSRSLDDIKATGRWSKRSFDGGELNEWKRWMKSIWLISGLENEISFRKLFQRCFERNFFSALSICSRACSVDKRKHLQRVLCRFVEPSLKFFQESFFKL